MSRGILHWATQPSLGRGGRDVIGVILLGQGLIRLVDGVLFNVMLLGYAPAPVWGVAQVALGLALLVTGGCRWRHRTAGRAIASLTAGLLAAMGAAAFEISASTTWACLTMSYYCLLEAGARGCE
jgi:hypothetical protein